MPLGCWYQLFKSQITELTRALLPFTPQAVLSPLALLVHSNVIFFFSLWKCLLSSMISLFNCTCFCCLICHVWVCTESPLSHSGLSNQEHISLRSPLPCHQWLGKKYLPTPPLLIVWLPALPITKSAESFSKHLWLAYYYFLPIYLTIPLLTLQRMLPPVSWIEHNTLLPQVLTVPGMLLEKLWLFHQ